MRNDDKKKIIKDLGVLIKRLEKINNKNINELLILAQKLKEYFKNNGKYSNFLYEKIPLFFIVCEEEIKNV